MPFMPVQNPRLVVSALEDGLLIYNPLTTQAHALDAQATRVFQACDGHTDQAELATRLGAHVLASTLTRLHQLGLIAKAADPSRRWALKAAAALPVILTAAAPQPAAAASSCITCPSGNCAACPAVGMCADCGQGAPNNCPSSVGRCVCLSNRDISVSSNCAGDVPSTPLQLCVDVKTTANQRAVADCSLARAQTSIDASATTMVLCDGSSFNVLANEYWCCMTCFGG